ncbi:WD40-repeat-containing domain protein [Multifurca ochricompacta]|uniref:WD40-repeat-containing domain protein n=1 Tax=Multifurca ochricompacta TaxID=376703 RepID=A0AAD4MDB9_9AGAM|nr:WD40-repeat-containing domain protein [Multifurca ochricompacta]
MNLARHSISPTDPLILYDVRFDPDCQIFTTSTPEGFAVYRALPLDLLRKREVSGGILSSVVPMHCSSLLFLVGGGRDPRYPPNKVVFWNEALGKEVAELEFREKVRGLACRRGWLAVALRRRVVAFEIGESVKRYGEWDTYDNTRGVIAIATGAYSTLLAAPARQPGHVQLIRLPPCPPPVPVGPPPPIPSRPPPPTTKHSHSVIVAHNTAITTLAVTPSGRLLATTSVRGTLVRVWDTATGKQIRELRRGSDQAEIYGVAFRPDEAEICVWSDKGTIHVFSLITGAGPLNRQSKLSSLTSFIPIPKYFESEWSYAQFRIPTQSAHISLTQQATARDANPDLVEEEKCTVGWIEASTLHSAADAPLPATEYQLIALTYTGGWYRLALPKMKTSSAPMGAAQANGTSSASVRSGRARSPSGSSVTAGGRTDKGKGVTRDSDRKEGRDCTLLEFRRFGSWDGWG